LKRVRRGGEGKGRKEATDALSRVNVPLPRVKNQNNKKHSILTNKRKGMKQKTKEGRGVKNN